MTYTHFWATRAVLPQPQWSKIYRDAKRILTVCDDLANYLLTDSRKEQSIRIDTLTEREHSLFLLTPNPVSFAYCRTNGETYDVAVTATLLAAKRHAPEWIKLTSDGLWGQWGDAVDLCAEVLNYQPEDFKAAKQDFDELLDREEKPCTEK
jgi:hypothetical protein